jgi:hypothetical protein
MAKKDWEIFISLPQIGECIIDIDKVKKVWNEKYGIFESTDGEFRIFKENLKANNFTKTLFNNTIKKKQALEIINVMNLKSDNGSGIFKSKIWRV